MHGSILNKKKHEPQVENIHKTRIFRSRGMSTSGREGLIAYPCNNCDYVTNNSAMLEYRMSIVHMAKKTTKSFPEKPSTAQFTGEARRQSTTTPFPRPFTSVSPDTHTVFSNLPQDSNRHSAQPTHRPWLNSKNNNQD